MLVIPMGTDAPIYHWPRATVAMIVLNVVMFFLVPPPRSQREVDENGDPVAESVSNFERYALTLGDGLHPVQWLTHNFLHYGFFHLLGNMVFIWAFGIVTEGKLGILKYLAAYLAIGTFHGALTQTLMLRSGVDGHAAGASAVVFGLLAMCMVWAPRNELNCIVIFIIGFRVLVFHWDLYYTTVALLYIGEQVLGLGLGGLTGRAVVSEMGHLSGAFWGTVIAAVFVKANWVDCEGWDLFALWDKRRKLAKDWKERGKAHDRQREHTKKTLKANARVASSDGSGSASGVEPEANSAERGAEAVRRVRKQIDKGDFAAALVAYDKAARSLVAWPSQPDLYALIKAMHAQKAEADSIPLMRDYCRYYPDDATKIRLKLAHVLIRDRQRPTAALHVLAEITASPLPPDLETIRQKLSRQASRMQEEGVLELEGDD